jgi:hypothetical protein
LVLLAKVVGSKGLSVVQKLAISAIAKVAKPEPTIIDVTVILIDGTTALLRLNAFASHHSLGSLPPSYGTKGPG